MIDLKPCPFCGSVLLRKKVVNTVAYVAVKCDVCGATGPICNGADRADNAWNKRVDSWNERTEKNALNPANDDKLKVKSNCRFYLKPTDNN